MDASLTYGKNERLKSRKRIDLLFKEGKRISVPPLLFVYRIHAVSGIRNAQSIIPMLQAGVGVRSKQFRQAVDRNRIKRLLRESWRTQKNALRDKVSVGTVNLDVFILYTGTELPSHAQVSAKTGEGIGKILERLLQDRSWHTANKESR